MSAGTVLVTGGAGYIGSHVVKQLRERGERIVVLDNLSTGFADAVGDAPLVVGDVGDREVVQRVLRDFGVETVMHFAAHTVVPESMRDPLKYYRNNTVSTCRLFESVRSANVPHLVFSSTAAVYGMPETGVADETTPTQPINPYGASKLMSEWMLRDLAQASSLRHITLRYFNVAGADPDTEIGQATEQSTLLIKVACEAAVGLRPDVSIYGTDYPTPDGTGIRDFIHVADLADAHLRALDYLRAGGDSGTLNCGYGRGYSVREVLDAVERISGCRLRVRTQPRRPGDPARLTADARRITRMLDWRPRYDRLDTIVETALNWERELMRRRAVAARTA